MSKKRQHNISKHIKTRHKKKLINRSAVSEPANPSVCNINKTITEELKIKSNQPTQPVDPGQGIAVQAMSIDNFNKLLGKGSGKKQKVGKFSVDDGIYLEKLLKKWGTNYGRMAQDVKLNRMQWTARQIQKKHESYKRIFPQEDCNNVQK